MPDTKLGPYGLLEELGRGGMAVVYRAYQPSVDRHVAIKVILKTIARDASAVQRFQREARLIARLEHPHILPVYDFDGTHDPPYIVMRYLEGGTLKEVLRQGVLPPAEISFLLWQVGAALDYAHRQGIVHRDIKPSNIMIDREGNAFVTDFGIARMADSSVVGGEQLTDSGAVVGTPDYMAPEQAKGESDIDHRADIYALGVIAFEMLTGQRPFVADTPMGVLLMHLQQPVPSALERNPALPPAVDGVIARALAKERAERYDSATALVEALTVALGGTVSTSAERLKRAAGESVVLRQVAIPAADAVTPSEQNRTVTVLYANAAEYVEVVEEASGGEAARQAINKLWSAAAQIISAQQGLLLKQDERELLAVWGAEATHEDDAERAIWTALAVQAALGDAERGAGRLVKSEPLPLNISLNTGLALLTPGQRKGQYSASGAAISLASRLMQQAEGAILITHDTFKQVRGVFDMEPDAPLKTRGAREPVLVYRVLAAKPRAFRVSVRGVEGVETQMVGREAELKLLQNVFLDAFEDSETHAITIEAEAGLGKSRLLYEFDNWSDLRSEQFWLLRGRATPETSSRPYGLLREVLSFRYEILDSDTPSVVQQKLEDGLRQQIGPADEIAHVLGYLAGFDLADSQFVKPLLGDPQQLAQRGRLMFGRWIAKLCAVSPVVIELEDIHHADNASLDLLSMLVSENAALPLLLICTTRPALYECRPAWGSGQTLHRRVTLEPLDKRAGRELARELLKKVADVPKALRDVLVERAEGNPYYMEELVKMLIDERVIVKDSAEAWHVETGRLGRLDVPTTLVGLLQARLDSLLYPERLTLQRAAVVGQTFFDGALAAINSVDETCVDDLPRILGRLVEGGFIQVRETSDFAGSTQYVFSSQLLRDMLLGMLLRRQVQTYNRACAEWLIGVAGERADEYSNLIASYYEKAGEAEQAAHYLQCGGKKALALGSLHEAVGLFGQALALLPAESRERVIAVVGAGETLMWLGEYAQARQRLEEGLALARKLGDTGNCAEALAHLGQITLEQGERIEATARLEESIALARQIGDKARLAHALWNLGWVAHRQGTFPEAWTQFEESLALYRELGNRQGQARALNGLGSTAMMLGQHQKDAVLFLESLALCREVGDRRGEAVVLSNLGETARVQGDYAAAQHYYLESLPISKETGDKLNIASILGCLGHIASALSQSLEGGGDYATARSYYGESLQVAMAIGAIPLVLDNLAGLASLQEHTGQSERALELLGPLRNHPSLQDETRQQFVEPILARLRAALPAETIEAGLARGQALKLEDVIQKFLAELSQGQGH